MDPRRVNDILKLCGAIGAAIAAIAPFVPPHYAAPLAAIAAFFAGFGTRGVGLEYKDVAEAKAKASMVPPAMSMVPPTLPQDQTPVE